MIGHSLEEQKADSFDQIPYPSHPYPQTSPDHMAVLGILSGMNPKAVDSSRVLELGCASGGNLVPLAFIYPKSEFIGIDFSGRAIRKAQESAGELYLENIRFIEQDLSNIDSSLGRFDYIIVHGIYSWVGPQVQEKLFSICRELLAPEGIAYFSYNVYPGWYTFRIVRDLMYFRTGRDIKDVEQIQQARKFLEYLAEKVPDYNIQLGSILSSIHNLIAEAEDGYVRHDFLADVNQPVYFADFIKRAEQHGLQYLANGELSTPLKVPEEVIEYVLNDEEDTIQREQYLDFLRNRTYRETLLCHREISISRVMDPQAISKLRVVSQVQPVEEEIDISSSEPVEFIEPNGLRLSTSHPLTKSALILLNDVWPFSLAYQALLAESWQLLAEASGASIDPDRAAQDARVLAGNLLRLYSESVDLVRFFSHQPDFVLELSEHPRASAAARCQAKSGKYITNLYHQRVTMDRFPRYLLQFLDGHHDHEQLLELTMSALEKGLFELSIEGTPVDDPLPIRAVVGEYLVLQLEQIARVALLTS